MSISTYLVTIIGELTLDTTKMEDGNFRKMGGGILSIDDVVVQRKAVCNFPYHII